MLCFKMLKTDSKFTKDFVIFAVLMCLAFSVGITIGYVISNFESAFCEHGSSADIMEAMRGSCSAKSVETDTGKVYLDRFLERQGKMFSCVHCSEECWDYGLPRTYLVHHLDGKTINLDGKLDDEAWSEVSIITCRTMYICI